jgi:hypothetical protein
MAMKHLSHLNITGFRGQVELITTGHIGVAGIMAAAVADTVIMDADMVVEDIGVVEDLGEEVVVVDSVVVEAEVDSVVEAVVEEVVVAVVEEVVVVVEEVVAADAKKSI